MAKRIDLTGHRFGRLTVIEYAGAQNQQSTWKCKCDCGNEKIVKRGLLRSGRTNSCGCLKIEKTIEKGINNFTNLEGKKIGRLTVLRKTEERYGEHLVIWECRCECGNIIKVNSASLIKKDTRSCGCLQKENGIKAALNIQDVLKKEFLKEGTSLCLLNQKLSKRNKSGVKGVFWNTRRKVWQAYIGFQNKKIDLGNFKTLEEAAQARKEAEEKYFQPILEKYGGRNEINE